MQQLSIDFRKQNSREAYELGKDKFNRIESICLSALKRLGKATHYQIAEFTCLESEQCRKRLSDLCNRHGVIEPCGKEMGNNGRSVTVWRVKG